MKEIEKKRLDYLINLQNDLRGELKQRISQRDSFSVQFIVSTGVLLSLGLQDNTFAPFILLIIPLVTLFYSMQIMYSYSLHKKLSSFLRNHIEPSIGELIDIAEGQTHNFFWEKNCEYNRRIDVQKTPGIRESFFRVVIFVAPFVASFLFFFVMLGRQENSVIGLVSIILITIFSCLIYSLLSLYIFKKKTHSQYPLGICDYKGAIPNKKNKAIFIDRDGTIIVDKVQTHRIEDLEFFPDTFEVLKKLQKLGYLLIVITNQDGIAQKKYSKETFHAFTAEMLDRLSQNGVLINAVYYSPHTSSENHYSFKPNPGMLYMAQDECNVDMDKSFFIGDKMTDIIAADNAGCKSILVTTGIYADNDYKTEEKIDLYNPTIAVSLEEAFGLIIKNQNI